MLAQRWPGGLAHSTALSPDCAAALRDWEPAEAETQAMDMDLVTPPASPRDMSLAASCSPPQPCSMWDTPAAIPPPLAEMPRAPIDRLPPPPPLPPLVGPTALEPALASPGRSAARLRPGRMQHPPVPDGQPRFRCRSLTWTRRSGPSSTAWTCNRNLVCPPALCKQRRRPMIWHCSAVHQLGRAH